MIVASNFGAVLGFIAGAILPFKTIPLVMSTVPCLFIILCTILPDTPNALLKQHKIKEAKESLLFYRSCKANDKEIPEKVNSEFDALLKSFVTPVNQMFTEKLSLSDFSKIILFYK